jgi:hypothetical protein
MQAIKPMFTKSIRLLFVGYVLATSGCSRTGSVPAGTPVTVRINWDDSVSPPRLDSAYVSVKGPVLAVVPGPRVEAVGRTIDGKQYRGIVVYEARDCTSPIIEVFVHGEENRVLIRTKSKVAFVIEPTDHVEKHLTWLVSGEKKEGPIELPPGQHQIEVVATEFGKVTGTKSSEDR